MIDWGDVLFYGTFLVTGIFRIISNRKKPGGRTGMQKLSEIGTILYCVFAALVLLLAFLPDGDFKRFISPVAKVAAVGALAIILISLVSLLKTRNNSEE